MGEALVPAVSHFLESLDIGHKEIIKHCNGTIKLGLVFDGFHIPGQEFTFPFGLGEHESFNTSSVMQMIKTEKIPSTIYQYTDISTHFRTTDLTAYMDTLVDKYHNLVITRKSVTKDELAGTYDLLVDCTGFGRHVSRIPDNFVDIKDKIPNNRAFTYRHTYTDPSQMKPYSKFKAMDHGWIWHIPLGDQLAIGYVHYDKYDVRQDFINYIEQTFGGVDESKINDVKFITGRNKIHMQDNVVALGLASAFIEPLESTGLYFVTSALSKIENYINGVIDQDQYNQAVNNEFDIVVDFIIAHYKHSKRDNEYWNMYKDVDITEYAELDIFPSLAWDYMLSGFGIVPTPTENVNPRELINIHRGMKYSEWINNEKNPT